MCTTSCASCALASPRRSSATHSSTRTRLISIDWGAGQTLHSHPLLSAEGGAQEGEDAAAPQHMARRSTLRCHASNALSLSLGGGVSDWFSLEFAWDLWGSTRSMTWADLPCNIQCSHAVLAAQRNMQCDTPAHGCANVRSVTRQHMGAPVYAV